MRRRSALVLAAGAGVDSPIVADTTTCTARAAPDAVADIGSIVLVPSGDGSAHRQAVRVIRTETGILPREYADRCRHVNRGTRGDCGKPQ